METLILLEPTKERNGILVKKTRNDINSCELRKISLSGRDNGYIASVNKSGTVVYTGSSWRSQPVNSPVNDSELNNLVKDNFFEIESIINQ